MNTRKENKKLKTEVICLKKEIERLKYMYQDLTFKI
jgi:cell division protein FtsB